MLYDATLHEKIKIAQDTYSDGVNIRLVKIQNEYRCCCFMLKQTPVVNVFYDPEKYDTTAAKKLLADIRKSLSGMKINFKEGFREHLYNPATKYFSFA